MSGISIVSPICSLFLILSLLCPKNLDRGRSQSFPSFFGMARGYSLYAHFEERRTRLTHLTGPRGLRSLWSAICGRRTSSGLSHRAECEVSSEICALPSRLPSNRHHHQKRVCISLTNRWCCRRGKSKRSMERKE